MPHFSYIKYLEAKVREVEAHLKQNCSGIRTKRDIEDLLERETERARTTAAISVSSNPNLSTSPGKLPSSGIDLTESPMLSRFVQQSRLAEFGPPTSIDGENAFWEPTPALRHEHLYYGHSSTCALSRDAILFRYDSRYHSRLTSGISSGGNLRPEFWKPAAFEVRQTKDQSRGLWETERMILELPPDDLMPILLDSYFDNTFFPVIHRQLFEKQLAEGLHKHENSFLRLVLLVCANGARWCNDPRGLDERWPISRSAGYRWSRQFDLWHMNLIITNQLSLWDAQILVLVAMYFCGSSATYGAWVTIGAAIRMMQDIGSHRRKAHNTLENELHKRCFWIMLSFDRLHSVHFGRNGAIADSEFDLDEVLEVDDELWSLEPGAPPPTQPPDIPAKLRVFNQAIALTKISGRCLQTVYALGQAKRLIGIDGPQGLARMVNDINSRLLNWAHSMPLDLQLPESRSLDRKPLPSAFINMWASYYELVISINRPFISKTSELAASCLAICREAAKAFAKMARVHCQLPESRSKFIPGLCYPAFSSAMVLAIDLIMQGHIKGSAIDRTGPSLDILDDPYTRHQKKDDMRVCVQLLEDGEEYFQLAGKLRDVVREFEGSLRFRSSSPPASPVLSGHRHLESQRGAHRFENSSNFSSFQTQDPASHDIMSQQLDVPNMPFDIFSGYEFANPYFLVPGIASGFPRADQLSDLGDVPFPDDMPGYLESTFLG